MQILTKFEQFHAQAKHNRWLRYFTVFTRVCLALGFLPSGFVKIVGERFTSLSVNHPMGNYLEALHHTGYYYTFIGILQITAALLLLIPRTALIGAILYFPIILNICILSLAVRFEGSLVSSPLMVLANLYLLCWDYDKLKSIFTADRLLKRETIDNKFPALFFGVGLSFVVVLVLALTQLFDIVPRNTINDCKSQCENSENPKACVIFCDCIHNQGKPLNNCLDEYHRSIKKNN